MRNLARLRTAISGVGLSVFLLAALSGSAFATPASGQKPQQPPTTNTISGPQAKAPDVKAAKPMQKLGPTALVQTDVNGVYEPTASSAMPMVGAVSNVDFATPYNYCYKNLVYTPVSNTTAAAKYVQVRLYNGSGSRDIYTSVAANSTSYPAFYGVEGTYYAYLYVWNGSTYQYDESLTNSNVCKVDVTRVYNTGGWVELKIQNTGTAYASQQSSELAPYPLNSTYPPYTGTQYDYPVAGGAAIYRWFWVGTSPYAIASDTLNSTTSPVFFTGDL